MDLYHKWNIKNGFAWPRVFELATLKYPSRFLRCFLGWKNSSGQKMWTLGQILMSLIHVWCFSKYPRCQGLSFASRLPSFSFVASDWDRLGQAQLHNLIINTKGQVKLRAINVDVSTTNTKKTSSLISIMTLVVEYQYWAFKIRSIFDQKWQDLIVGYLEIYSSYLTAPDKTGILTKFLVKIQFLWLCQSAKLSEIKNNWHYQFLTYLVYYWCMNVFN